MVLLKFTDEAQIPDQDVFLSEDLILPTSL